MQITRGLKVGNLVSLVVDGTDFQDLEELLTHSWGGGEGVFNLNDFTNMIASAQGTPSLVVSVAEGYGVISDGNQNRVVHVPATDLTFTDPGNTRGDRIQVTWIPGIGDSLNVKEGTAGSATPPAADALSISIATIALINGITQITASEITDVRTFL